MEYLNIGNNTYKIKPPAPSGPPRDLKLEPADKNSLRVTWKPPLKEEWNGDIQGYQVGYRLASSNSSYVYETVEFSKENRKEHHLIISDLSIYTEYAVVVSAFNKVGQGPRSKEVKAHTAEGSPQKPPQVWNNNMKTTYLNGFCYRT